MNKDAASQDRLTPEEQYEALCAFEAWTKNDRASWNLGYVRENGKFARYFDPDTDTAWLGFEAAWKLLSKWKRIATAQPFPSLTDR